MLRNLLARWRGRAPVMPPPVGAEVVDPHFDTASLRLLLLCERPAATQDVHLLRPLRRLRSSGACALAIASEPSLASPEGARWLDEAWATLRPNALIFSRFAGPLAAHAMAGARRAGAPIIAHLDDFLLEVPPDLGADKVKRHNRPERIAALRETLTQADLLFISTESLADGLRRRGIDRPMVVAQLQSCADPDEIVPPPAATDRVRIGYQGTRNHHLDLDMIVPALTRVLQARPNVSLELFGSIETPAGLEGFGDRVRRHAPVADYETFLDAMKAKRWDVGLAPLRATEFNSFRTYTKWTEYTLAGVPVVASEGVVYRDVIGDDDAGLMVEDADWEAALLRVVDDAGLRASLAENAQRRLVRDLTLERMEAQVLSVLESAGVSREAIAGCAGARP